MNQWFNSSHPLTLQAGVILGYISAFFGILTLPTFFILFLGLGAGAFITANNRRWGYMMLAVCAVLIAVIDVGVFLLSVYQLKLIPSLQFLNRAVFPVALAAAVLHPHSREYQKIWFE